MNWTNGEISMCMWPPYTPNSPTRAMNTFEELSKSTTDGSSQTMGMPDNYDEVQRNLDQIEEYIDIENSIEQQRKRSFSEVSSSEEDDEEYGTQKKQCIYFDIPEVSPEPPKCIFSTSSEACAGGTTPVESKRSFQELFKVDNESDRNKPKPSAMEETLLGLMKNIQSQLTHNQALLKSIMEQSNICSNVNVPHIPDNITLPLNSTTEVDRFELQNENKEFKKKMIAYLSTIGGQDTASTARRVMSKLLTNRCAQSYNMKGKGEKCGLANTHLLSVVRQAVRNNHLVKHATDSDIDRVVGDWLRYAKDRDGGRRKRPR